MKKLVTIFLAAAFLLVMYVPVSAAEWDFYGSARVTTFWTDYSDDRVDITTITGDEPQLEDNADTIQLNHTLQGNSRFGGTVSHGAVKGGFEFSSAVSTRLLYGTVDLGFGEFLIGQHYVPLAAGSFLSNQVWNSDNNMLQFVAYTGRGASGRAPMGQLSINDFKLALVEVQETGSPEVLIPQVQASYDLKMEGVALNFGGGYQTYDLDGGEGESLDSYMAAVNAKLTMMDPMYINFGGFFGQNVGNMGQAGNGYTPGSAIVSGTGDIDDIDTYGVLLVLGAKLDTIGIEAGAGYRESEADSGGEAEMMGYYLQATVPMSQDGRAFIVPEVGYNDYDDFGDETYAGLKWQVNF